MSINKPSIVQLMSYPMSMSNQQNSIQPNALSAQKMSAQLVNLCVTIKE